MDLSDKDQNDLFRQTYPVTSAAHRETMLLAGGMRLVVEQLKGSGCQLPGMVLAIAIAEATLAKEQIALSGFAYREAAKAGANLSAVTAIYTQRVRGTDDFEMIVESEGPPNG